MSCRSDMLVDKATAEELVRAAAKNAEEKTQLLLSVSKKPELWEGLKEDEVVDLLRAELQRETKGMTKLCHHPLVAEIAHFLHSCHSVPAGLGHGNVGVVLLQLVLCWVAAACCFRQCASPFWAYLHRLSKVELPRMALGQHVFGMHWPAWVLVGV